jgi:hypothetical protein
MLQMAYPMAESLLEYPTFCAYNSKEYANRWTLSLVHLLQFKKTHMEWIK